MNTNNIEIEVSVIMASYNCEDFISYSIDSVLNQTFSNWELIVVDDNSSDNTINIIQSYVQKDNRIKFYKLESNGGAAIARNKAIENASGRFIAFLDSDDIWYNAKLEKQISFMIQNNYSLTYTYYNKIDEEGSSLNQTVTPPHSLTYQDMLKANQIGCLTAIYDSKVLGKQFMPLIKKRQDYGLWLQILKTIHSAFCLAESLANYRVRKSSISSNKLDLIKYNWVLFNKIEKLSYVKSFYYLCCNIWRKINKW